MFSLDVYKDQNAPGFALLGVTIKKYGLQSLDTDPTLLRDIIEKDFDIKLSQLQADKLQAAISVANTDSFYTDWRVFETTCHLFHNEPVDPSLVNPLDAEDIAIGLAEATLIKHDTSDAGEKHVFDDEIRAYAGKIFYDYGMSKSPKIFPTAIMPKSLGSDDNDKEKNTALKELFDAHAEYIVEYVERLQ